MYLSQCWQNKSATGSQSTTESKSRAGKLQKQKLSFQPQTRTRSGKCIMHNKWTGKWQQVKGWCGQVWPNVEMRPSCAGRCGDEVTGKGRRVWGWRKCALITYHVWSKAGDSRTFDCSAKRNTCLPCQYIYLLAKYTKYGCKWKHQVAPSMANAEVHFLKWSLEANYRTSQSL